MLERLRGTPGVDSAAVATILPFGDYTMGAVVQREGRRLKNEDPDAKGKIVQVIEYVVGGNYCCSASCWAGA